MGFFCVTNTFEKAEIKKSPTDWALRWVWNHPETEGNSKMFYNAFVEASERADKCVECGKCEKHD